MTMCSLPHLDTPGGLKRLLHISLLGRCPQSLPQQEVALLSKGLRPCRLPLCPLEQVPGCDEATLARKHIADLRAGQDLCCARAQAGEKPPKRRAKP